MDKIFHESRDKIVNALLQVEKLNQLPMILRVTSTNILIIMRSISVGEESISKQKSTGIVTNYSQKTNPTDRNVYNWQAKQIKYQKRLRK
jgi:hypothetical protein